jgi:hypothetical protein
MRCFPTESGRPNDRTRRHFGGVRRNVAHLLGVELTVRGLAFQQQDIGVSACATTAIWSALQKVRDHEEVSAATPAQITLLASKHSLPFGRSMPSEGLSIDQMCQAIQAVGIAPSMVRLDNLREARGFLHAALMSDLAPVAILRNASVSHAVAVVGMKVRRAGTGEAVARDSNDLAGDVVALYVHDDRHGPYLRANLIGNAAGRPALFISLREAQSAAEVWELTHLLFPVHAKVRLSFAGLRRAAIQVVQAVHQFREGVVKRFTPGAVTDPRVYFETWVQRAHRYVEALFQGNHTCPPERIDELCSKVLLARYVGVVRVRGGYFDRIDLLLDTTGTVSNAHALAVVVVGARGGLTRVIAQFLGRQFHCPVIGVGGQA